MVCSRACRQAWFFSHKRLHVILHSAHAKTMFFWSWPFIAALLCSDLATLHDFPGGWAWCVREPVDRHGSSHTRGFVLYCIVHMPKQCFVLSWLFIAALLAATWQRCMIFRGDGQGVFASMSTGMVLLTPEASFYAA
jgi:hypothetical protein